MAAKRRRSSTYPIWNRFGYRMLRRKTSATPETVISRLPPRSPCFSSIFLVEAVTARAFPISNTNFSNHFSCNLKHTSSSIIQDDLKIFLIQHRDAVHTLGRLKLDFEPKAAKDTASLATFSVSLKPI